jgi:hypothetical protein
MASHAAESHRFRFLARILPGKSAGALNAPNADSTWPVPLDRAETDDTSVRPA